jgi:hypothetical protein
MLEPAFRRWVGEVDTVILVCWDLGHIWSADLYDNVEKRPHGAHLLVGSCQRHCGVVRARYLTSSWSPDATKNTYKYPRNYSPKGLPEFAKSGFFMSAEHRAAIRREIARRADEDKGQGRTRKVRTSRGTTNVVSAEARFSG